MSLNILIDSYVSLQPSLLQTEHAQLSLPFPHRPCFPNPLSPSLLSCERFFPINPFKNVLPHTEHSAPLPLLLKESSSISIIISPGFPTALLLTILFLGHLVWLLKQGGEYCKQGIALGTRCTTKVGPGWAGGGLPAGGTLSMPGTRLGKAGGWRGSRLWTSACKESLRGPESRLWLCHPAEPISPGSAVFCHLGGFHSDLQTAQRNSMAPSIFCRCVAAAHFITLRPAERTAWLCWISVRFFNLSPKHHVIL